VQDWPIVRRESILDHLVARLGGARRRSQLLRGPSGVGKTTLASTVAASLGVGGRVVVPVVALAELRSVPMGALAPLLASERFRHLASADERLAALVNAIGSTAADHVLLVDDAPLLDEVSAAAVYQLARVYGVRTLLTARDEHPITGPIARLLHEDLVEITQLEGFSDDELREVLVRRLGAGVSPHTVQGLRARTMGNPLFVRELVLAAEREHGVHSGPFGLEFDLAGLPAHILASVAGHLDSLGAPARALLRRIALSQPWPREAVLPTDESALDELLRADAVSEQSIGAGRYVRVVHPMYAEAVAARSERERREDRLAAAARLEPLDDGQYRFTALCLRLDADQQIAVADLEWAASYAQAAGDHGSALRLADAALAAGSGFAAMIVRAGALSALGDAEAAGRSFEQATALATGPRERAVAASRQGQHIAYRLGSPALAVDEVEPLLAGLDDAGRALLAPDLAKWRVMAGDRAGLTQLAASPDDLAAALSTAVGQAMFATMAGQAAPARVAVAAGRPLAGLASDAMPFAPQLLDLSEFLVLVAEGRLGDARAFAEQRRSAAIPDAAGQWSYALAIVHAQDGGLAAAAHLAALAVEQLRWRDFTGLLGAATALHAGIQAQLGEVEAARSALDALTAAHRDDVKVVLHAAEAEAWLLAAEGRTDAAADAVHRAAVTGLEFRHDLLTAMTLALLTRLGHGARSAPLLREAADRSGSEFIAAVAAQAEALHAGDVAGVVELTDRLVSAGHVATAVEGLLLAERLAQRDRAPRLAMRAAARRADIARPGMVLVNRARDPDIELTEREREVAVAAARRERNREIAERLGLSLRTVENHLASVYRKLGVTGRDELARALDEVSPI
jgi:DNA-binding CsgD family transcriptional regulator